MLLADNIQLDTEDHVDDSIDLDDMRRGLLEATLHVLNE